MALKGAVLGDIAGSWYEENRPDDLDWKNVPLYDSRCCFTDDTVMSLAVKKAVGEGTDFTETLRKVGFNHPYCGYGKTFFLWMFCRDPFPYNSFGNGSAMRVSYIGEYFDRLEDVQKYAEMSAKITHNHPEGIKGAVVTATCIWMAKKGQSKEQILQYAAEHYPPGKYRYSPVHSLEEIRETCEWSVTCQDSVPLAIRCFYEADSFEEFIRNVYSLRCDTDTIGAIGGGIAEEYYNGFCFAEKDVIKRCFSGELYKQYKKSGTKESVEDWLISHYLSEDLKNIYKEDYYEK